MNVFEVFAKLFMVRKENKFIKNFIFKANKTSQIENCHTVYK